MDWTVVHFHLEKYFIFESSQLSIDKNQQFEPMGGGWFGLLFLFNIILLKCTYTKKSSYLFIFYIGNLHMYFSIKNTQYQTFAGFIRDSVLEMIVY